jgi:hypothetical protein
MPDGLAAPRTPHLLANQQPAAEQLSTVTPVEPYGTLWNPMEPHGTLWNLMEPYRMLWNLLVADQMISNDDIYQCI